MTRTDSLGLIRMRKAIIRVNTKSPRDYFKSAGDHQWIEGLNREFNFLNIWSILIEIMIW